MPLAQDWCGVPASLSGNPMLGYLFAGQGSQYIGMGQELYEAFPESRAIFEKADNALGFALSEICFKGPSEKLKQTDISQPAIVTVSIAALAAFRTQQPKQPHYVAGLSLGEYSALIAAGVFTFEDGLRLVRKRGQIMEAAAQKNPGTMAAVLELPVSTLEQICKASGAEIANLNAPGQIVITGTVAAVNKAMDLCTSAGAKRVIALEVSGGFHSSLMKEAAAELRRCIASTPRSEPQVPIISNYTAQPASTLLEIENNLVFQLYSSVQWERSVRTMLAAGIEDFVEFGPGKVLKGLMRKIEPAARVVSIEKKDDLNAALTMR